MDCHSSGSLRLTYSYKRYQYLPENIHSLTVILQQLQNPDNIIMYLTLMSTGDLILK